MKISKKKNVQHKKSDDGGQRPPNITRCGFCGKMVNGACTEIYEYETCFNKPK